MINIFKHSSLTKLLLKISNYYSTTSSLIYSCTIGGLLDLVQYVCDQTIII